MLSRASVGKGGGENGKGGEGGLSHLLARMMDGWAETRREERARWKAWAGGEEGRQETKGFGEDGVDAALICEQGRVFGCEREVVGAANGGQFGKTD